MATLKVVFKKSGTAYGFGHFAGEKASISKADFEKLEKLGVVEEEKSKPAKEAPEQN
jgi:hypothetical protein